MTAEIIAVGTELLLGSIANTNARDISRSLSELGINVYFHTVVGDNPERLSEAVGIARARAFNSHTCSPSEIAAGNGPVFRDS